MRKHEKKILIRFLEDCVEHMGNAGCNDFQISDQGLSDEERQQLVDDYCEYMRRTGGWEDEDVEWAQKSDCLTDFCVLSMLQEKLERSLS